MHDARTQRPTAVTFTCAYASVSVRARAPRGSSACDHLAECHAELFPLRASLRFATSTLCFFLSRHLYVLYFIYIYIRSKKSVARSWQSKRISNDRSYGKTGFRRTTRKLRGPVSIAPRDSSTLLSQRVQTLSFRLFITESPRERDRRLCAVSGEFGASRARIGGLNVEQRISLVFYDSCSTFQPNRAHDAIIRSGSKQNATILFSPPTQSTNYNYRHVNRPDTSTANSTSSQRQTTNVFRSNNPGLLTKLP